MRQPPQRTPPKKPRAHRGATYTASEQLNEGQLVVVEADGFISPVRASDHRLETRPRARRKTASTVVHNRVVRNRVQVIKYSRILIAAFDEVLDYDQDRHHNLPPPELYIGDPEYIAEVRRLVAELHRLNSLLDQQKPKVKETSGVVRNLAKYADRFALSFSQSLGKSLGKTISSPTGWLAIGTLAALLTDAGVAQQVITAILAKIPK